MSLARILNQTAYVASVTSTDSFGKPTYGPPAARAVRVEQASAMVTNARGDEVASSHRLWCLQPIKITDRVWLPGADTSSAEASSLPISVSSVGDFSNTRTLYRAAL